MKHVFYDTETTGPEPMYDQVLQAAAILTDEDFVEIDTIDVRSRLAGHIIPTAGALKVTHVDPYDIARAPFSAYEFARHVNETFFQWSKGDMTSFAGYNTISFDEEIMRHMFWQSLQDPYLTSGKNKTRTDYLTMVKALHARNPEVIEFPLKEGTEKKSFKLEHIAPANGFAGHDAHDALGDVRATIFLARLIRDTDPHLYAHMLEMGNANTAKAFVEDQIVFQLMGGPMANPGVLDVCLIAEEATNPKNKSAWNLALDPTPYLDLTPEAILEAMKKSGTPFRTVKCNKQPAAFPMNWGFLNRVTTDSYAPAEAHVIDERAEMIRNHHGFQAAVAEALALKTAGYDAPEHLEEKIYAGGFPSWDDKNRMQRFHSCTDWSQRLDITREMQKPELRAIGLRLVFLNAPEVMTPELVKAIDDRLTEERFTLETDRPWTTLGNVMTELDAMQEKDPEDPELINIRKWYLETYPLTQGWEDHKQMLAARKASEEALAATDKAAQEAGADPEQRAGSTAQAGTATAADEATDVAAEMAERNLPADVSPQKRAKAVRAKAESKAKTDQGQKPKSKVAEMAMSFLDGLE